MESNCTSRWILGLAYAAEVAKLYFYSFYSWEEGKGKWT